MKNTNRLIFAALAAVALIFAAACSDSSADDSDTISTPDLAGTTWEYSHSENGTLCTTILKFESGGKATSLYYEDGELIEGDTCSGTYSVSGSMVSLKLDELEYSTMVGQYTYSAEHLALGLIYTTTSSVGSASELAGTTWSYSETPYTTTYTTMLKFESGGKVDILLYVNDELIAGESSSGTYSVAGSMVTIELDSGIDSGTTMRLAYSSGQLFWIMFTKVS